MRLPIFRQVMSDRFAAFLASGGCESASGVSVFDGMKLSALLMSSSSRRVGALTDLELCAKHEIGRRDF